MATCPRCARALRRGHRCRPLWLQRLPRRAGAVVIGAAVGASVHQLVDSASVPVLGTVIGGISFVTVSLFSGAFRHQ
jgi:hypothetical protein